MKAQRKKGYEWLRELPKKKQKEWRKEAHKCLTNTYGTVSFIEHQLNSVYSKQQFFVRSFIIIKTKNPSYWRNKIGL